MPSLTLRRPTAILTAPCAAAMAVAISIKRHETHLPAQPHQTQAFPRFPGPHGNPRRTAGIEAAAQQGAGKAYALVGSGGGRRWAGLAANRVGLARRIYKSTSCILSFVNPGDDRESLPVSTPGSSDPPRRIPHGVSRRSESAGGSATGAPEGQWARARQAGSCRQPQGCTQRCRPQPGSASGEGKLQA